MLLKRGIIWAYKTMRRLITAVPSIRSILVESWLARRLDVTLHRYFSLMVPNPVVSGEGFGLVLNFPKGSAETAARVLAGAYEPGTIADMKKSLNPGALFVDVGAFIGYLSIIAARCVGPKGRVYAFEPSPTSFPLLVENIIANGQEKVVRPVQKAISNKSKTATMWLSEGGGGNSLHRTALADISSNKDVDVTTLDEFFASEGWPPINVVKIDVEGSEKEALEGMRELAVRNPHLKLIIEFHPSNLAAAGTSPANLVETILSLNFFRASTLSGVYQQMRLPNDLPRLVQMAGTGYVNLLCEKEPS